MEDYKLDDLLLYTAEELDPDQKAFIKQHQDELGEEDKSAYSTFLNEPVEEETEEIIPQPEITPPAESEVAPPPVTPEEPRVFKTQEEIDAYMDSKLPKAPEEPKPSVQDKIKQILPDDYKPETPTELYAKFKEALVLETKDDEERANQIQQQFDKQYLEVVTKNNLPDPKTDTGKQVKEQIRDLGIRYKANSYNEAYDLWSKLPQKFGGGLDYQPPTPEPEPKPDLSEQKRRAAMANAIPGGDGGGSSNKGLSYSDLAGKDLDTLLEEV
jgi:hypothetical protein